MSRARPDALLSGVIVRHAGDTGLGFPSGHAAVAAALASEKVQAILDGGQPEKVIARPPKLVNLVV